ncbi:MAG: type II secretion system F family protein [Candidatus Aenigmarchaeota archaeon]|nr:type II secretion system F family protein [Candidatus Aenigmarchaeota archaeon]
MIIELAIFIGFIIPVYFIYAKYSKNKEIYNYFPIFIQEVYNNTSTGMSLVDAVKKSKDVNYGCLSPMIKNMCLQIEWGVPFDKAVKNFGKKVNNSFIDRMVILMDKVSQFSLDIGKNMGEIYDYIALTKKLERERKTELFPQLISLYFIFFVFLGIILIIFNFFIPYFETFEVLEYRNIFIHLVFIESVFLGLTLGKMIENSFVAGLKHMTILCTITFIFVMLLF